MIYGDGIHCAPRTYLLYSGYPSPIDSECQHLFYDANSYIKVYRYLLKPLFTQHGLIDANIHPLVYIGWFNYHVTLRGELE